MEVELLAPAGSYEGMKAAFLAGADAVYLGGTRFGARAYAHNLEEEELKQAINYAHLRGKKLYLTVNTLLKDWEMEELYDYLLPLYREGLDAAIVQDMGVFSFLRKTFPGLSLHASTQMTITDSAGAYFLKQNGADRVVTARELSLKEIRAIHESVDIEIESFVHGALCFCYSGQCLLSSFIGGRSGNRGRCAQPCRLPYSLEEASGRLIKSSGSYLMSPKDICTLENIPDLVESGIYSFKIEGRMKKPEYAAGVTSVYRKYLDLYLEHGRDYFHVQREDYERLMDLYNRGGFSKGYYQQHNGKDMMSLKQPNHWGTEAARAVGSVKNVKWTALEELHEGDVLEYRDGKEKKELVCRQNAKEHEILSIKIPDAAPRPGSILYRTRNQRLLQTLKDTCLEAQDKVKINGKLILSLEKPAILELWCEDTRIQVSGAVVQSARNRPLQVSEARRQILKMGQSSFSLEYLEVLTEGEIFLPVQALNELRRTAAAELEKAMLQRYHRDDAEMQPGAGKAPAEGQNGIQPVRRADSGRNGLALTVSVETMEQFFVVLDIPEVQRIYLSCLCFSDREDFLENAGRYLESIRNHKKEGWLILPWICRRQEIPEADRQKIWERIRKFDGVLMKNPGELELLKENGYSGKLAPDYNLYSWNREAEEFWQEQGAMFCTLPVELNEKELRQRGCEGDELVVYGYLPLMASAQCFLKNTGGCTKARCLLFLKDRMGKRFPVKNDCAACCNMVYNCLPMELASCDKEIRSLHPASVRVSLTIEDKDGAEKAVRHYAGIFCHNQTGTCFHKEYTKGHFKRGTE